jgi:hypothetical protein
LDQSIAREAMSVLHFSCRQNITLGWGESVWASFRARARERGTKEREAEDMREKKPLFIGFLCECFFLRGLVICADSGGCIDVVVRRRRRECREQANGNKCEAENAIESTLREQGALPALRYWFKDFWLTLCVAVKVITARRASHLLLSVVS